MTAQHIGPSDTCIACQGPYSKALGHYLHAPNCRRFDPSSYRPPLLITRAHRWMGARYAFRRGEARGDSARWTPMRARLFPAFVLRYPWTCLSLWSTYYGPLARWRL